MTVEALRRGRPEVLEDLLAEHGTLLHRVAFLILGDSAAADDIVADTLLAAFDHGRDLRDADALRPWLIRIASNRSLTYRRGAARVVQIQVLPELGGGQESIDLDERATLWAAVVSLPKKMRTAVVLHYFVDLPVDDVAQAMGVSSNTIKTQLKSALAHLRASLADQPTAEEQHARA